MRNAQIISIKLALNVSEQEINAMSIEEYHRNLEALEYRAEQAKKDK